MKLKALSMMFFAVAVMGESLESSENGRCARCGRADCQNAEEIIYYPYCLNYQDSSVVNVTNEDGQNYWPAKRDDDFVDALTR